MNPEQVRLASMTLGPLLRKRGTSPALGASLRRAVAALDKALVADDDAVTSAAASEATAELQGCLSFIRESSRPADHDQLDGIAKVLSFLIPAEPAAAPELAPELETVAPWVLAPSPPAPPPQPMPTAPPISTAAPAPEAHAPLPIVELVFPTARLRLASLRENLRLLRVAFVSPFATLRGLDGVCARHQTIAQAIRWAGKKNLAAFRRESESAEDAEKHLVARLALVHLGDPDGVERILAGIEEAAAKGGALPAIAAPLLRILSHTTAAEGLLSAFRKWTSDGLHALLLPVLAELGAFSPQELLDLAAHPSDAVAVPAAEALAWSGDARDTPLLLGWALGAESPERANALLFAAVALGSAAALAEVRKRAGLGYPSIVARHFVDALAVAGDEADADILLARAASADDGVIHAILAAANLGCVDTVGKLTSLADRVPGVVLEEARRMIQGSGHGKAFESGTRLCRGRPWSVSAVLSCLASPDEPVQTQRRLALELRVRTNVAPPTLFPPLTAGSARAELLANWAAPFAKASRRLRPGGWYYQGRPTKRADEEQGERRP